MITSEVQRTLVKSPPELWAELSDPASLARHLGELGEIRITRIEPEQMVEWEAEATSGTVLIKASGWGTKVTLTVARELPEREPSEPEEPEDPSPQAAIPPIAEPATLVEPSSIAEPGPIAQPEAAALRGPEAIAQPEAAPPAPPAEPEQAIEPEVLAEAAPARQTRRGLLSRLFGRGRRDGEMEPASEAPAPEPHHLEPAPQADGAAAAESAQPEATSGAEPSAEPPEGSPEAQEARDIAAELRAAEEVAVEQVTAVLTSMLDRLGAAHHRPFSRA